jgi:hypothetical protein
MIDHKSITEYVDDIITEVVNLSRSISDKEGDLSTYGEMLLSMNLLRVKSDIKYINDCVKSKNVFYKDEYPW